jgi:glycosyltransferase involved in cell wall biosynthesis
VTQTYPNIELIVVDDCSPAPARSALPEYLPESFSYTCLRHEENRGANAARNTGIRAAAGDVVSFLDDDDRWDPGKTAAEVDRFAADDRVGVVLHGQRILHDGRITRVRTPDVAGDATVDLLRGKPGATFSGMAVRRSIVDAAGLPDESLPSWQDREWLIRLSEHCRFAVQPEPLVLRGSGSYDQISDGYETKRDVSYPRLVERHRETAARHGQADAFVASLSAMLAASALQHGRSRDARHYALRSIGHDPTIRGAYLYLLFGLTGDRLFTLLVRCKRATSRAMRLIRR